MGFFICNIYIYIYDTFHSEANSILFRYTYTHLGQGEIELRLARASHEIGRLGIAGPAEARPTQFQGAEYQVQLSGSGGTFGQRVPSHNMRFRV